MIKILPLFGLISCSAVLDRGHELKELYRLRIPNSSKVIYDFHFEGPMAFSTPNTGVTILDSTTTFSRSVIDEFPGEYTFTLRGNEIHTVEFSELEENQDTTLKPVGEYQIEKEGIVINVLQYQRLGGYSVSGCGGQDHFFDSFKETRDSLYFYGVKRKFGKVKPDTCVYPKGKIKIIESENGDVTEIRINELINGLRDTYRPGKPTTVVPNQPVICIAQVSFIPSKPMKSIEFSDIGIFKKVRELEIKK